MEENQRLLSHSVAAEALEKTVQEMRKRIQKQGDKPHVTVEQQLQLLDEMQQFEFGRFLLQHRGINGYWTHYMLTHPWYGRKTGVVTSDLERFILDEAPVLLATQQRFEVFLQQNQKAVVDGAALACIPCGMMGELLYLNFDGVKDIELVGIDFDADALVDAATLAEQRHLTQFTNLEQKDAWSLGVTAEYDLISSNGLNIYEPDDDKVLQLYQQFYTALKPGGRLVTSFITFPPGMADTCEWQLSDINQEALLLQRIIFADIIEAKWQCFRTTQKTREQLIQVGFRNIEFIYDSAHIFPTVVAFR